MSSRALPWRDASPGDFVTDSRSPPSFSADLVRLKWLSVVLMTACHLLLTGQHPYNSIGIFVGATVFPIFAGMIVIHLAAEPERRCRRYLVSLAVAAVLAEVPYLLLNRAALDWPRQVPLNALATFFCGTALCALEYRRRYLVLALSSAAVIGLGIVGLDGWFTAPLAMLIGFVGLRRKLWPAPVAFAVVAAALAINDLIDIASFDAKCHLVGLALLPLVYGLGKLRIDLPAGPRLFFYAYYPGHLLLVWLLLGAYPVGATAQDPVVAADQPARNAAVQFLAFRLINVTSRPAYCRQRGTDISLWTQAFVRVNAQNYAKSRQILSRGSFDPDQVEADLDRQLSPGFEKGIADAMAATAAQLHVPEDQICAVFARNDPSIAGSLRLEVSNPALSQALSQSP